MLKIRKSDVMKVCKKILIWGLGKDFQKLWAYYQREEEKHNIEIVALIDKKIGNLAYPIKKIIITKNDIKNYVFDYIIISSTVCFFEIMDEIIEYGIDPDKVIDGKIFTVKDFDFNEFYQKERLKERIFDGCFQDNTYIDRERIYEGRNVSICLGRKSYVGCSYCEGDYGDLRTEIFIGNYTSIAWDVYWELGLNLDHDYRRVFNYGITHFDWDYRDAFDEVKFGGNKINIGSDVWIGRGCRIKTGLTIGNGAVIAANSVVVGSVPAYAIFGGNPAKFIKYRFDCHIRKKLEAIQWWNWTNKKIEDNFKIFLEPQKFVDIFYRKSK